MNMELEFQLTRRLRVVAPVCPGLKQVSQEVGSWVGGGLIVWGDEW